MFMRKNKYKGCEILLYLFLLLWVKKKIFAHISASKALLTWVYLSVHPCGGLCLPTWDAQVFCATVCRSIGMQRLHERSCCSKIYIWCGCMCMCLNPDSVNSNTHVDVKLGAGAVILQPLHLGSHE